MIDRRLNYGRHLVRRFAAACPDARRVLDVGAGTGGDLRVVRAVLPAAELYGIDAYAPNVGELAAAGIHAAQIDIEREPLPYAGGFFDLVIANQILEHVKEIFWVLHETSRVLRPGGSLIIGVPNLAALHNRLLLLAGRQPTPIRSWSAHVRGFTRRDLVDLMQRAAPGVYRTAQWGGSNFYPFPPFLARPLARLAPDLASSLFVRFARAGDYGRQFLAYPVAQGLETSFFLGDRRHLLDGRPAPRATEGARCTEGT